MADLTIGMVKMEACRISFRCVKMLEACSPFQPVYEDATTKKFGLAEASDTAKDKVYGLTLLMAFADGPALLLENGDRVNLGAILVKGTQYCLSTNNGMIAPQADLVAGDAVVPLFLAETDSIAAINVFVPAVDIIL